MRSNNPFFNSLIEISAMKLLLDGPDRLINKNGVYFNWGILWDVLSPLIMVAGWSLLLTAGIRGGLFDIRNFAYILTFWFAFSAHVQNGLNYSPPLQLLRKKGVNGFNIDISLILMTTFSLMIRILIISLIFYYFDTKIYYFHIVTSFFLVIFFAAFYLAFVRILFFKRTFLISAHAYFLQAIFIFSSIIIPIQLMPESVREFILYNPLVHLFEWIKAPYSGIYFSYIDINYFLYFIFVGFLIAPICIHMFFKNLN